MKTLVLCRWGGFLQEDTWLQRSAPFEYGLSMALAEHGEAWVAGFLNVPEATVVEFIGTKRPDLVIYIGPSFLNGDVSLHIKQMVNAWGGHTVVWGLDYWAGSPLLGFRQCLPKAVDAIFLCAGDDTYDYYKLVSDRMQAPVFYLPFAAPRYWLEERAEHDANLAYTCVFIGYHGTSTSYGRRAAILERIGQEIPLKLINETGIAARQQVWLDMPRIYRSSLISLNISHTNSGNYTSDRLFLIGAAGGCIVAEEFPECRQLYNDDEATWFSDAEDAIVKIKDLLAKPDVMNSKRERARARTLQEHTIQHRVDKMLGILGGLQCA